MLSNLSMMALVVLTALVLGVPVYSQTDLTFDVWRESTTSTYHAVSQTTPSSFTGSLKTVVERAVSELAAYGGGTILFAAGDFDLGSDYFKLHNVANITFAGRGMDATVLHNWTDAAADTEPFNCTNCDRLTIRDMTIAAGGPRRSTSDAIDLDDGDYNLIERVKVTYSRARAIVFDGKGANSHADDNIVRDCVIEGTIPLDGIQLLASNRNRVEGCTITGVGRHGIYADKASEDAPQPNKSSDDNVIIGNWVQDAAHHGIAVDSGNRNVIAKNTVLNNAQHGIYITGTLSHQSNDNIVAYNTATGDQYGLFIATDACNHTVVIANDFSLNTRGAIFNNGADTLITQDGSASFVP